ncbi:putative transcriptional regulator [Azorhizobium caulinodans ORS 571]|uniref:Putative transcriptional regulator n=2 Tax=Azorhizobium caulinodans TaxID=7 RepID=A8IIW3_AZOC5|nr:putative transcriptional regulator [Azorhizobium caulinodans ORS 571]
MAGNAQIDKYAPFGKYPCMTTDRPETDEPQVGTCTPTLPGFTCGLDATLRVIAGKWKPLILYFLAQGGPTRYGELRRAVRDVSDKMLIQQLKELEADQLVKRTDYKEVPPRVDYALTPLGQSLAQALVPLCQWGTENMEDVTRVYAERASWGARTSRAT